MKKIMIFVAAVMMTAMFVGCGNNSAATVAANDADSTAVDTTVVDTLSVDSLANDTTVCVD